MAGRILRGGMIGAGAWSDVQLTAWRDVGKAEIVALCDRHPERLEPMARKFGIGSTHGDLAAMLDAEDLDFVDVCVRPYSHASLAGMVADRGLPVLCQKPFCTSLEEATETVEHCRRTGVRLMVNENFRWQAWYRQARELLEAGALGEPFAARILRRSRMTLPTFGHSQTYFADMPRLIVYEMGVHYLDTLRFLFGEPDTIYARLHHASTHVVGEDVQLITLGYPDLTCMVNQSWASVMVPGVDLPEAGDTEASWPYGNPPPRFEIEGTEATLTLLPDRTMHLYRDSDHRQWTFPASVRAESHVAAQQHFVDCLLTGSEFETSGEETLKTMALVYGCYRSADEGRVVTPAEMV